MSEADIFEAQGRAHADAKRLRSDIASATVVLREARKWLHGLDARIDNALRIGNPSERHREITAFTAEIRTQRADTLGHVAELMEELEAKGIELTELENEIGKF